jgi:hypothetical protein
MTMKCRGFLKAVVDDFELSLSFHECLPDYLDPELPIGCHHQLVVAYPKDQAEEVARLVEEVMVEGMDEIVNPSLQPTSSTVSPQWSNLKPLGSSGNCAYATNCSAIRPSTCSQLTSPVGSRTSSPKALA